MTRRINDLLRVWGQLELGAGCLLLAIIVALISYQIVARSFWNAPLAWAEEAGTALFIWVVFLGASAAAKIDRHITVSSLGPLVGERGTAILVQFGRLATIVAAIWIMVLIMPFVGIESRSSSVSLPIRVPKSWFFSVPLVFCCVSMALGSALSMIRDLAGGRAAADPDLARALIGSQADEAEGF